jgi:orotate phosphoribosyltransferase
MKSQIIKWLFDTQALKISPADQPFWYTAGKIGPYYINTHYLYGSPEKAEQLLAHINEILSDRLGCPEELDRLTHENYLSDPIYKGVIDKAVDLIRTSVNLDEVDYISGGERRDWFLSYIIARLINKPHLTIYKDLSVALTENDQTSMLSAGALDGKQVMHIAELVTEASSYDRAWIPAVEALGGRILWTQYVIDRKQGGEEFFAKHNIQALPMIHVDETLFNSALEQNLISKEQYDLLCGYYANPDATMKAFIDSHPDFLANALKADPKTAARAKLCIEQGFYK